MKQVSRPLRFAACLWCLFAFFGAGCGSGGGDGEPIVPPPLDVRLNTDGPGEELSQTPQICCDGNQVYVVWSDRRDGGLDIRFNRSVDWGEQWLATDRRLDTDATGAAGSIAPVICCASDDVYVAWHDERNGLDDIYFNVSHDAGSSWRANDIRLSTSSPGTSRSRVPMICCVGNDIFVVWEDNRNGGWDIYFNRSLDGGASWLASDIRVNTDSAGADDARAPQIVCVGTSVYVAWLDDRDGGSDLRFRRTLDRGATWSSSDARLNVGTSAGGTVTEYSFQASGNQVVAIYTDARAGAADVFANRSSDQGATWFATDVRVSDGAAGTHESSAVDLCLFGDQLYVTWLDDRNGLDDVYFNRSLDGGVTWVTNDIRIETDAPGAFMSQAPSISCDLDRVNIAWFDSRAGQTDVFLSHSPNRGGLWLTREVRVDDDPVGSAHSVQPQACAEGSRVWVTWTDQRDGPGDVYVRGADFGALR